MKGRANSLDQHLAAIIREAVHTELAEIIHTEIQSALSELGGMAAQEPYLDVTAAARAAHCHPQTIRLYVKKGQLPAKRIGKRVLISRIDLDNFLSQKSQ